MIFKTINKKSIVKIISLCLAIYLIFCSFIISKADSYEWTVINNIDTIETNSAVEGEDNVTSENALNTVKDELGLECESAILIEQTTRSNII